LTHTDTGTAQFFDALRGDSLVLLALGAEPEGRL
jgi:hypothetical protein